MKVIETKDLVIVRHWFKWYVLVAGGTQSKRIHIGKRDK